MTITHYCDLSQQHSSHRVQEDKKKEIQQFSWKCLQTKQDLRRRFRFQSQLNDGKIPFDLKTQKYVCDRPKMQKHIYTCPIQDAIKSARPHLIGLFPHQRDVTQNSDLRPPHLQQVSYAFVTLTQQE